MCKQGKDMAKIRKFVSLMSVTVSLVAMFASCDYWNEDWYKSGNSENVPLSSSSGTGGSSGGNGGSSSSSAEGTTTVSYTSYDSLGDYLNIDGGQYRTCTLTGNSTGGMIVLSDGIKADLTGSYVAMGGGTRNSGSSLSLAATEIGGIPNVIPSGILIEGSFTVTFSSGITCYIIVDKDFIIEKDISSSGQTVFHVAGKAARDYDSAGDVTSIVPGSAEDPVNGTAWAIRSYSRPDHRFDGGYVKNLTGDKTFGPYTVSKTDEGYKICWGFWSMTEPIFGYWHSLYYNFTIADANTTEASYWVTSSRYDNVAIEMGKNSSLGSIRKFEQ